jgi:dipeptidyl aminopeptidase/acylaminoacyl peptidase
VDRADAVQGELDPAWSPDGRSVAFAGRLTDAAGVLMNNRLYVLRAGAAEPEIVVNQLGQRGGLRFPGWSPDGTRIAYLTGVPPADQQYRGLAHRDRRRPDRHRGHRRGRPVLSIACDDFCGASSRPSTHRSLGRALSTCGVCRSAEQCWI